MTDKKNENNENENRAAETRQGAASAGGYDAPQRPQADEEETPARGLDPDLAATAQNEDIEGDGTDDDGRLSSAEARAAAGPFTGTGNQDAMRTQGRLGGTDAHAADTRTVEADAKDNTNKEADAATKADAKEQRESRDS